MDWVLKASGVEDMLTKLTAILLAVLGLVLIVALCVLWERYSALPAPLRVALLVALNIVAVTLLYALQPDIAGVYDVAVAWSTDKWMRFDGFTRSHPWVGGVLFIFWMWLLLAPGNERGR